MKYIQNCYLHRRQNNWINLFEMREKYALSVQILSRYPGIFFERREKAKNQVEFSTWINKTLVNLLSFSLFSPLEVTPPWRVERACPN